jgi:3-oxoacyl-[acyl-carrier protein] reductase
VNVAVEAEVVAAMDRIVGDFGSLAVLVNNAGIPREAAERMIRGGTAGVIINISSVSRHGTAGQTNYSAAKAGVAALSVVWAKELARCGIRTGTIAPGGTRTEILSSIRPEMLDELLAPVPWQRWGEPEEIAAAAAFIVSNDFFTGRCIDLDGALRI